MTEAKVLHPPIAPYVFYEDAGSAADWLQRVYGFTARFPVKKDESGRVGHVELELGGALVMLSDGPATDGPYRNPSHQGGRPTVGMYVLVHDVDAHFEHSKAEGATITSAPQSFDYGARHYETRDIEGHLWWFWSPTSP